MDSASKQGESKDKPKPNGQRRDDHPKAQSGQSGRGRPILGRGALSSPDSSSTDSGAKLSQDSSTTGGVQGSSAATSRTRGTHSPPPSSIYHGTQQNALLTPMVQVRPQNALPTAMGHSFIQYVYPIAMSHSVRPTAMGHSFQQNASSAMGHSIQQNASSAMGHSIQEDAPSATGHSIRQNASSAMGHSIQQNSSSAMGNSAQQNSSSAMGHSAQQNSSSAMGHSIQQNSSSAMGHSAQQNSTSASMGQSVYLNPIFSSISLGVFSTPAVLPTNGAYHLWMAHPYCFFVDETSQRRRSSTRNSAGAAMTLNTGQSLWTVGENELSRRNESSCFYSQLMAESNNFKANTLEDHSDGVFSVSNTEVTASEKLLLRSRLNNIAPTATKDMDPAEAEALWGDMSLMTTERLDYQNEAVQRLLQEE